MKLFRPAMMETTEITVITPMMTPRSVRKLRSLLIVSAPAAMRIVSMSLTARGLRRAVLRILLFLHLRAVFDLAQRAERSRHDLLSFGNAAHDLDRVVAGEAGLHRRELHRAVAMDEHAFFILRLRAFAARFLADDERLNRNGQRLRARAGDDFRRSRESGPHA